MLRKSKLSKALLLSPKNDCTEIKFVLIYVKSQVHLPEQFICIRKWFPPFHHWEGTHGPMCCISKCSQRTVLSPRTWVCLHLRARAIRGELCSCVCGGNTAEHSEMKKHQALLLAPAKREPRDGQTCRRMERHTGKWSKDWLSQKLSLNFSSIDLSTEVSISFLFIPAFSSSALYGKKAGKILKVGQAVLFIRDLAAVLVVQSWGSCCGKEADGSTGRSGQ